MRYIIPAIFVIMIASYVIQMVRSYRELAPDAGTVIEHVWAAAWGSATKLWAKLVGLTASLLGIVASSADLLNAPQVTAAIQQYLSPQVVTGILLGIMLITEFARGRTLDKS